MCDEEEASKCILEVRWEFTQWLTKEKSAILKETKSSKATRTNRLIKTYIIFVEKKVGFKSTKKEKFWEETLVGKKNTTINIKPNKTSWNKLRNYKEKEIQSNTTQSLFLWRIFSKDWYQESYILGCQFVTIAICDLYGTLETDMKKGIIKSIPWRNYLLFMDELKIFAISAREINGLVSTVQIFNKDIEMKFRIKECVVCL